MPSTRRFSARSLIGLAVALALAFTLPGLVSAQGTDQMTGTPTRSVTVVGSGTSSVVPDIASLSLGVETKMANVSDAVSANRDSMDAIMTALADAGVAEKDIRTTDYSIFYDEGSQGQEPAYRVSNTVNVNVRDLGMVGDVIDAAVQAGANRIFGINLTVSDWTPTQDEARSQAVSDAQRRAEDLAQLVGMQLGEVLSISEVVGGGVSPLPRMATAASAGPAISPGQLDYTATVQITYALQPSSGTPSATGTPTAGATDSGALTPEQLQNAIYLSDYGPEGSVQLTDGSFKGPAAPRSATEIVVQLASQMAFGDLNGDGSEDAVVVLVTQPGGSGSFYDLAAVLNEGGEPVNVAIAFLGDRAKLNGLSIADGQIAVDMVIQGPNDPMCCPTHRVTQTYALEGDQLVNVGTKAGETAIQLPDGTVCQFAGTGATLAFDGKRLNYTCGEMDGDQVALLGEPEISGTDWTVEKAVIGHGDEGFFVRDSETVSMTVSSVELEDGTVCLNAGRGATLAFEGKRLNYTCEEQGNNTIGLIGDFQQEDGYWMAERALIVHSDKGFALSESSEEPIVLLTGQETEQ